MPIRYLDPSVHKALHKLPADQRGYVLFQERWRAPPHEPGRINPPDNDLSLAYVVVGKANEFSIGDEDSQILDAIRGHRSFSIVPFLKLSTSIDDLDPRKKMDSVYGAAKATGVELPDFILMDDDSSRYFTFYKRMPGDPEFNATWERKHPGYGRTTCFGPLHNFPGSLSDNGLREAGFVQRR